MRADEQLFVAPDNGALAWCSTATHIAIILLTNARYWLGEVSHTTRRDIFAPVAAHLARGVPLEELRGVSIGDPVRLDLPEPRVRGASSRARWCG